MDARSPGDRKRRRTSPSDELHSMGSQQQHPSQTSLPSIHQLDLVHLYPGTTSAPPQSTTTSQHPNDPPAYAYSNAPHYGVVGPAPHEAPHPMGAQRDTEQYGAGDSDDIDLNGPPKKKRRRQALSCTECKRRKIKCDRTQPCTPCARRGEEAGCQWHIVEPVEKYATKAEFDELKARFAELAALVQRLMPNPSNIPYYTIPGIQGAGDEGYPPGNTGGLGYASTMMPLPAPPPLQYLDTSSQPQNRYMKAEGASSPSRHALGGPSASPVLPPAHRRSDPAPKSASTAAKSSPLSLAAITSPYHPDAGPGYPTTSTPSSAAPTGMHPPPHLPAPHPHPHAQQQPKNCRAQTLIPGARLRSAIIEGPVSITAHPMRPRAAATLALAGRCMRPSTTLRLRTLRRRITARPSWREAAGARCGGSAIRPRAGARHATTASETALLLQA